MNHVRSVMYHLGFKLNEPTRIFEDSSTTIEVSNNERVTRKLRHFDIRNFAILDWVKNGDVVLKSTTSDNPSDELTKTLGSILHSRHSNFLFWQETTVLFLFLIVILISCFYLLACNSFIFSR